jgi:hypothetical protein
MSAEGRFDHNVNVFMRIKRDVLKKPGAYSNVEGSYRKKNV